VRKALVLAALAVILLANSWGVIAALRNRATARGGTVELTERELRLEQLAGDSTVTLLRLRWDTLPGGRGNEGVPQWLDASKLEELGFECQVPATSPHARQHYGAMGSALVYVVLEYMGEAWKKSGEQRAAGTRLFAVDAGTDPVALRQKHPNEALHVIVRGLVRPHLREKKDSRQASSSPPVLCGRVEQILPPLIFVPSSKAELLRDLRRRGWEEGQDREEEAPRFAVVVSWGEAYEPWVSSVRLLSPPDASREVGQVLKTRRREEPSRFTIR
jgi:hypothetical protein